MLLFVQLHATRAFICCKHDMGTLSWLNAELLKTLWQTCRCSIHGVSLASTYENIVCSMKKYIGVCWPNIYMAEMAAVNTDFLGRPLLLTCPLFFTADMPLILPIEVLGVLLKEVVKIVSVSIGEGVCVCELYIQVYNFNYTQS